MIGVIHDTYSYRNVTVEEDNESSNSQELMMKSKDSTSY